jgi:salicylate hydroxylase
MGPGAHVLTFLVQHGKMMNVVAFKTNSEDWPDYNRLTRPAKREQALEDFKEFGPSILNLLKLSKEDLDCVSLFEAPRMLLTANSGPSLTSTTTLHHP